MKVNVTHPSFISFLESVSNNILTAIKIDDYFTLTQEKKLSISFTVLNLIKNSAKVRANLSESGLKGFITVICKKYEENENYEIAAILRDVINNFDKISEMSNSTKKPPTKTKNITPQQ